MSEDITKGWIPDKDGNFPMRRVKHITRGDGKRTDVRHQELYDNPIKEITITPYWYDGALNNLRDYAIQWLTGYVWACRYARDFHAVHDERGECEQLLERLTFLKQKEEGQDWWPSAEEDTQLTLIDFVRIISRLWD